MRRAAAARRCGGGSPWPAIPKAIATTRSPLIGLRAGTARRQGFWRAASCHGSGNRGGSLRPHAILLTFSAVRYLINQSARPRCWQRPPSAEARLHPAGRRPSASRSAAHLPSWPALRLCAAGPSPCSSARSAAGPCSASQQFQSTVRRPQVPMRHVGAPAAAAPVGAQPRRAARRTRRTALPLDSPSVHHPPHRSHQSSHSVVGWD